MTPEPSFAGYSKDPSTQRTPRTRRYKYERPNKPFLCVLCVLCVERAWGHGLMFIKICGITRLKDAAAAVDAGANAIGLVFWPESPRFIDPYRARAIVRSLPPFVTPVGLFVNQPREYITAVASLVRLGAVQLHGDETKEFAASISLPVIKAVPIERPDDIVAWPADTTLLLDAYDPVKRGGT